MFYSIDPRRLKKKRADFEEFRLKKRDFEEFRLKRKGANFDDEQVEYFYSNAKVDYF